MAGAMPAILFWLIVVELDPILDEEAHLGLRFRSVSDVL